MRNTKRKKPQPITYLGGGVFRLSPDGTPHALHLGVSALRQLETVEGRATIGKQYRAMCRTLGHPEPRTISFPTVHAIESAILEAGYPRTDALQNV